ncbi:asparagine synthase C-terminal domain-containing protein [Nocardia asteroides]|uniref:asparagine synthase C-terminal domain-containing protein n=1 Tax=Nocardia asteroides TaxID=1824 RepID=UPI0037CB319E
MSSSNSAVSDQSSEAWQQVADLRDIATPDPGRRRIADPAVAAELLSNELMDRISTVLAAHPGEPIVMLSGGVDSIAVAAAAVRLGARPHAVTVVTRDGASTDAVGATAAARALGLTHELIELDDQDIDELARESVARLGISELWEVSYAVPLLAMARHLDQRSNVGPILTGSAADAILAGGKVLHHPVESVDAVDEMDRIIRKESNSNFRFDRLVPDFQDRIIPRYAGRFIHTFQTLRFWEIAESFAPPALFGSADGAPVDKLALRTACAQLLPEGARDLAWAKKSPIQRSAGIMGALENAARRAAAALPGAQTYTDPMTESAEAVATRLYLALLAKQE